MDYDSLMNTGLIFADDCGKLPGGMRRCYRIVKRCNTFHFDI